MDKHRIIALLARKMAGEATPHELEELEELMASFPDSVYYEELLKQFWQMNHMPQLPDPALAFERHCARFEGEISAAQRPSLIKKIKRSKLPWLAALILLVGTGVFAFFMSGRHQSTAMVEIVSAKGLRKKISLPDGTVVWLNSDSRLSYHAQMEKQRTRKVHLVGEAFFQVTHKKNQPFIVRTEKMAVKVLGTSFNLKAYANDEKAEATLIQGSIELSINDRPEQKIMLSPSEKFAFVQRKNIKDITLRIQQLDPVKIGDKEYIEETSWKESRLIFRNETFEELKPRLERWYNVKIDLQSEAARSYKFTGIFEQENIEEALTALQLIKPFNFKIKAYDIIIY